MGYKPIANIKILLPLIINTFTESIQVLNLSTLNHNVRFLPCQHRGVGIMQYVYACFTMAIVLIIPRTLPQRGFPSGLWT